jgi:hypothetical protein
MAVFHIKSTVGTAVKKLFTLPTGLARNVAVQIQNLDSAAIFIGDSTITTSGATRGHSIAANTSFQIWLNSGDSIYAISAAGTAAGAVVITYSGI